jgi:tetratricopeptide (TPR) repeat protein
VNQGCTGIEIALAQTFIVSGDPEAEVLKSLYSIQNPDLMQGTIHGDSLFLSLILTESGTSEIIVRGEYEGEVEYCSFTVTVSALTADDALNQAIACFQSTDYQAAANYFSIVISKDSPQSLSDGYMGLGFCQMRQQMAAVAYQSFSTSRTIDDSNLHALAGLSLLEYAYTKNYREAIRNGQEILSIQPGYIFKYDESLDFHDILINIALSQYSLQLFEDCLKSIQEIEPAFILDPSDPEFQTKLLIKLEALVKQYC